MRAPLPARVWAVPIAIAVAIALCIRGFGGDLLGWPGGETYGHAWVQSWQAEHWPGLAARTDRIVPDAPWPVIDPAITWVAVGLQRLVGRVIGWNLVVGAAIAGAFAGGWLLARRVDGDPWTGALTLSLAPAFGGALASGLTEDFAIGLLAVALALVGRPGRGVACGLCLGALAWTGPYLALMGALGAVVVGAWTWRQAWRDLLLAAALASVLALGAMALQGTRITGEGHRSGEPVEQYEPAWRVNPARGADLASLVVPGPARVESGAILRWHPAYLGWVALIAAFFAGRRGGPWWVVLAVAVVLLPGATLKVAGWPTGVPDPFVWVASRLPGLSLVNHWGRFGLLAAVALAALASIGARGRPWIAVLVAAEILLLSPTPWPLPAADASVAAIDEALDELADGAVLVVPSAGPGVHAQRVLYRQIGHGRPVVAHPNRPGYGPATDVPLVRWFASLPGRVADPPDPDVARSLARLEKLGVAVIVVDEPYVERVAAVLGPPSVTRADGAAWSLGAEQRAEHPTQDP